MRAENHHYLFLCLGFWNEGEGRKKAKRQLTLSPLKKSRLRKKGKKENKEKRERETDHRRSLVVGRGGGEKEEGKEENGILPPFFSSSREIWEFMTSLTFPFPSASLSPSGPKRYFLADGTAVVFVQI